MKIQLLFLLLAASFYACTKKTEAVVPVDPIAGEWALHYIVYSQFDKQLDSLNRLDSNANNIGFDTYIFKSDGSYSEKFAGFDFYSVDQKNLSTGTEIGTWTYDASVKPSPLFILSRTSPAGPFYTPTFISKSEFKMKYTRPYVLDGAVLNYAEEFYYRKKGI